jgi:ribosome-binding protein aMBF1 (putative translation factor)
MAKDCQEISVELIEREAVRVAAELVRTARQSAGFDYMQLAQHMHVHHFQVRRLENAENFVKGPTLATLMRVARACNKTLKLSLE